MGRGHNGTVTQQRNIKYIGLTSINFPIRDFQKANGILLYTLIRRSWLVVSNYTRQYSLYNRWKEKNKIPFILGRR